MVRLRTDLPHTPGLATHRRDPGAGGRAGVNARSVGAARRAGALCALVFALACAAAGSARAQLAVCASIGDDRERLACYDALARAEHADTSATTPHQDDVPAATAASRPAPATELERSWELRPDLKRGTFELRQYRALYALAHYTTRTNPNPSSPTRVAPEPDIQLDPLEARMQLSLKSKLVENLLGSATDVWFGYTQQSFWQAANTRYSSPFRETDYAPEAIFIHPLGLERGGVAARYAAVSLSHQSNGRGASLSRSWNRVIGDVAFESGPWSLEIRPWLRIHERSGSRDDNPDIDDFVGRGEVTAVYRAGGHVVTLTGRHTLRGGERSRGSGEIDWAFPLTGSLNGHVQVFSGYGESLIDYNHRQTTFGLGVSFFD